MCFTPKISLLTAIIELVIASLVFLRYKKSELAKFVALFIFLLGFYQFTEYMLCTSGEIQLWGRMGFVAYTILPAVGIHLTLSYTKRKFNRLLVYIPTIVFILIAALDPQFVILGSCGQLFVSVNHYFNDLANHAAASFIYWSYYCGYVLAMSLLLFLSIKQEKNHKKINAYLLILLTLLLVIIPPFVLVNLFPAIEHAFPSVYCQFALIYAVVALIGVYLDDHIRKSLIQRFLKVIKRK